jgi:hypothetical protein
MTKHVARPRALAKSAQTPKGNPIPQKGNQISPVMQKVKSLLPAHKPSMHLSILIDEKDQHCRKLLSGERHENEEVLSKLLRSWMGRDVLFVVMEGANSDWFSKYRKQLDVNAARRQLEENRRAIEALQAEAAE